MRNTIRKRLGSYTMSSPAMRPVARIWPNGEFSLGYTKVGEEGSSREEWLWTGGDKGLTEEELNVRLECLDGWLDAVASVYSVSGRLATVMLTLSSTSNSHEGRPPSKYGLNGLTGNGKKMIRSGAYLLEKKLGRSDVVVTTLTVPAMTQPERIAVARQWGVLTNRLVQYLTRELLSAGRKPTIIGCVEIQTERLSSSREGYLHLHLLHPAFSNTGQGWAVDTKALLTWWAEALERVTKTTLTHPPRIQMEQVKDSLEFYLSKYLSKGGEDDMGQFVADLGYESVPGQWWLCSAPMRQAIRENTLSGENCGVLLESVVQRILAEAALDEVEYLLPVDMMLGEKLTHVGWVGRLRGPLHDELTLMLRTG